MLPLAVRRCSLPNLLVGVVLLPLFGCGQLNGTGMATLDSITREKGEVRNEEAQRRRFREERDPEAMRWLLGHRIQAGMSVTDVNQVFGEEGVREYGDRWIKASNNLYRQGDVIYKWGPDSKGHTAYLAFREGRLVNFDPEEYRK